MHVLFFGALCCGCGAEYTEPRNVFCAVGVVLSAPNHEMRLNNRICLVRLYDILFLFYDVFIHHCHSVVPSRM